MNVEGSGVDFPVRSTNPCADSLPRLRQTTALAICDKEDKENNKKDKELVDRMVAQAFMMNNIGVDVIQSPSFISMVKSIAEFGSGYSLPSCATLCTKLLQDAKKEVDEYVSAVKGSWINMKMMAKYNDLEMQDKCALDYENLGEFIKKNPGERGEDLDDGNEKPQPTGMNGDTIMLNDGSSSL
ncbi:Calmodulin-binding protein [Thalictrum thalictroides]|uniref:Calmodulin-binding protein n=1 Tax=Thalictrum thalictroides TaxID=46969 RepID=A0A7J6W908_THATH|nr:Calmodulin-binding protein [Thalictrum thalictroides]